MLDTVALRHSRPMPLPSELINLGFHPIVCEHSNKWVNNPPKGSNLPRLTWSRNDGGEWVTAEVSLPKFAKGSNVHTLSESDLKSALSDFEDYTSEVAQTDFDVDSAIVSRVDYAHNFKLQNELDVKEYLRAFQKLSHSRYSRRNDNDSTVTFFHKSKTTCVYSKFDESKEKEEPPEVVKLATAVLRFEHRLKKADACRYFAEKHAVSPLGAGLLNNQMAFAAIKNEMALLGMDKGVKTLSDRDEKIRALFGNKAWEYFGFLYSYEKYGESFWKDGLIARATYFRRLNDLKNNGLLVTAPRELPALTVHH